MPGKIKTIGTTYLHIVCVNAAGNHLHNHQSCQNFFLPYSRKNVFLGYASLQ